MENTAAERHRICTNGTRYLTFSYIDRLRTPLKNMLGTGNGREFHFLGMHYALDSLNQETLPLLEA